MKKTIRTLVICMAAVMLLAMFASCGAEKVSENAVTVNVKITAGDTVIFDDEVFVNSDEPTVMKAFQQAMDDDNEFPVVVFDNDENPMHVKDIGDFVDGDKFWEFRVNDIPFSEIKGAAGVYAIKEGDQIFWEYGVAAEDTAE